MSKNMDDKRGDDNGLFGWIGNWKRNFDNMHNDQLRSPITAQPTRTIIAVWNVSRR
jgi:hypothetical protein